MKMDALPSTSAHGDDDKQNLSHLLDVFGSVVSLEDIASAYCQAGRNVHGASEILCHLQGSSSGISSLVSEDDPEGTASQFSGSYTSAKKSQFSTGKPKRCSASIGSVSGVIGKEYVRPLPRTDESCKVNKPLKLYASEFSILDTNDQNLQPETREEKDVMHQEVEEFLFKMLGEGFRLDMTVIQDIAGQCGYDVRKSMEKLLDVSASTLGKSDDIVDGASQKPIERILESTPRAGKHSYKDSGGSSKAENGNELQSSTRERDRSSLQKEVLKALFSVPERNEEAEPTNQRREARRARLASRVVAKPLEEKRIEYPPVVTRPRLREKTDEDFDDNYEVLRKAVKEYWATMKEYYRAAFDAFAEYDDERANKLLEEGHFFMKKAREADEKSAQILIQTRDDEEELSIDLHEFEPKDAVRFLKLQLTSLSGIESIQNLKVVVGSETTSAEKSKDARRKHVITRLLERDSIKWSEEGNGWIMVIRVSEIDPKKLSFGKKSG